MNSVAASHSLPITKIIYSEGGFNSYSSTFVIDVKAHTFICGEGTPDGMPLTWHPKLRIPDADIETLDNLIDGCHFLSWKSEYVEPHILDGTQWELKIKSGRRVLLKVYGSNLWPEEWQYVEKLLEFCRSQVHCGPREEDD